MRRWIVALIAVAFLAGGPALAAGKAGCCAGGKNPAMSARVPAGAPGGAMMPGGCAQMQAGACGGAMKAGCGMAMQGGAGGHGAGRMGAMRCGPMGMMGGAACCGKSLPASQDPSNIWYRGPAPRRTMADWACDKGRWGRHAHMRAGRGMGMNCAPGMNCPPGMKCGPGMNCPPGMKCGPGMGSGSQMNCGGPGQGGMSMNMGGCGMMGSSSNMEGAQKDWMAGAGKPCGAGCPHAKGPTAWKSGCRAGASAPASAPRGGCCAGQPSKG